MQTFTRCESLNEKFPRNAASTNRTENDGSATKDNSALHASRLLPNNQKMPSPPKTSFTAPIQRKLNDTTTQCAKLTPNSLMLGHLSSQNSDEYGEPSPMLSSPPSVILTTRIPSPHRRTLSHPDSLYRDQPPNQHHLEILKNPMPLSRALSRIEQRRQAGLSTPKSALTSSAKVVQFGQLEERTLSQSLTELAPNGEAQDSHRSHHSETTRPHISRLKTGRAKSTRSVRTKSTTAPFDEWEEAGTPETNTTDSRRSSFVSKLKLASCSKSKINSSVRKPNSYSFATKSSSIDGIVSQHINMSKDLAAEKSLEASTKTDNENKTYGRRRSLSDLLRDAQTLRQSKRLNYEPTREVLYDKSGSDVGFIKPRVLPDLLNHVLPRLQSDRFVDLLPTQVQMPKQHSLKIHKMDNEKSSLKKSYTRASSPHAEFAFPQDPPKPTLDSAQISSHQYDEVDSSSLPPIQRIISRDPARPEQNPAPTMMTQIVDKVSAISMNNLSLSPITMCASQFPIPSKHHLSLKSSIAVSTKGPRIFTQDLSIASPVTLFDQTPRSINANLILKSPVATFSQRPVSPLPLRGLDFTEACAIVYFLIAYTALWLLLSSAGEDVHVADVVNRLGITFSAGTIFCILLHWSMGGFITQVIRAVLRSIRIFFFCVAVLWGIGSIIQQNR